MMFESLPPVTVESFSSLEPTVVIMGADYNPMAKLAEHILDPEPHPAYDDIPSFALIFENGLI